MAVEFSKEEQEELKKNTAEIYQQRTDGSNAEDIKNLSGKKKWEHFREYYLRNVIIVALVACVAIFAVVQAIIGKENIVLYVAILNDIIQEEDIPAFEDAIADYLNLAEDESVRVSIDGTDHQLQTYFYTGTADILIASEDDFYDWAQSEYFYAANKFDEVSFFNDYDESYRYYTQYVTTEDVMSNHDTMTTETVASDKTMYNCGLYLTDCDKYKELGGGYDTPVIGISLMTEHLSDSVKFVQYMMDNSVQLNLEDYAQETAVTEETKEID